MSSIRLIIDVERQRSSDQEEVPVEDIVERALKSTGLFGAVAVAVDRAPRKDVWVSEIGAYLRGIEHGRIASVEVWRLIDGPYDARMVRDNSCMTAAMRSLGWERGLKRLAGYPQRCFVRGRGWPEWFVFVDPVDGRMEVRQIDDVFPPVSAPIPIRRDGWESSQGAAPDLGRVGERSSATTPRVTPAE